MSRKKISVIIASSWLLPMFALAATVTSNTDVTLVLPSDSSSYTLSNGAGFTSVVASSGTFTFVIPPGSSITLTSTDKKKLSNDAGVSTVCDSDRSYINVKVSADSQSSQTVVVTPTGSCTTSTGTTGGGGSPSLGASGGGGGGGSVSSTPIQPPSTPAASVAKPSAVAQAVSPVFNVNIIPGAKGSDVSRLQQLLATDKSLYPEGLVTGFAGPATARAIKAFQKKYGISQTGTVGPLTRAKLQQVFGKGSPAAVLTPASAPASAQTSSDKTAKAQALLKQLQDLQKMLDALKKK